MDIAQANDEFGIDGALQICAGNGGFAVIRIHNEHARADICSYVGQVLSYQPEGEKDDLLFVSEQAHFKPGKAIKGGIPVCWPWFGPDPHGRGGPDHGFVRARQWKLLQTEMMVDGSCRVRLGIKDNEASHALWAHPFALQIEVKVGATLDVALISQNHGDAPMILTQALHSYFKIGDIRQAQVLGLSGYDYIDKVGESAQRSQSGPINFDGPVNRIYLETTEELVIDDPSLGRRIQIEREGSRSAVVWNPWIEQSRSMRDFGDQDYLQMVCVETTNAATDAVELPPGNTYRLASRYAIRRD